MSSAIWIPSMAIAGILLLVLGQFIVWRRLGRDNRRLRGQLQQAEQRLQQLANELGALCSASAGAGEHVIKLEQQMRRVIERQNLLELRASADRPYTQASQLAHEGADVAELVNSCGLTRGEAELMVMLHGAAGRS